MIAKELNEQHLEKRVRVPALDKEGDLGLVFQIVEIGQTNIALWTGPDCDQFTINEDEPVEILTEPV